MAPRRLNTRSQNKRKNTREVAIQTSYSSPNLNILKSFLQPQVVLERLDMEKYNLKNGNARHVESSKVFKSPTNYSGFVQPITNNQNVNSTLLTQTKNSTNFSTPLSTQSSVNPKRPEFIKPGPLCFKRMIMERLKRQEQGKAEESLKIPAVLEDVIEEVTETPSLEEVLDIQANANEPEATDITNTPQLVPDNYQDLGNDEDDGNVEPSNIRIEFKGVTTVISAKSSDDNNSNSDDEEHFSEHRRDSEHSSIPKFIKINASTVHIHNHFYKSCS